MSMTKEDVWGAYQWLQNELTSLIGATRFSAEINLRLERITHLLELLDNPHTKYRTIHVGGTSGKGSTTIMIASILKEAGYKVGLHQSPNIQVLNERHWVDGRFAPTTRLIEIWKTMKPAVQEVTETSPWGAPSYFEAQIAMAFLYFAEEQVDVAVIEVGLGGMRDATNVIKSEVAVLTNVGLDHTAILGETVEEIVLDKRGIIKPNQIVVSGCTQPTVQALVAEQATEVGAQLYQLGTDFTVSKNANNEITMILPDSVLNCVEIGLSGDFQMQNGILAAMAALSLKESCVSENAIRAGLRHATVAGRMEIMQQNPLVLLDGAHNPDKIRGAAELMANTTANQRVITVIGLKAGKAATDILPPALELSDIIIMTSFGIKGLWSAVPAQELAELAKEIDPEKSIQIIDEPITAVKAALSLAEVNDVVWITGSLYLVGDAREYWHPSSDILYQLEQAKLPFPA